MYTKNGQGPFPVPSTGQFGSMIGTTSAANSPQEALQKTKQQLPMIAPGFMVKNGLMDVKMKDGYYLVETQSGGRKTRRNKRNKRNKSKTKKRKTKTRRY